MYKLKGARFLLVEALFLLAMGVLSMGQGVVINEIAWAGTAAQASDEWIELHNPTDEAVDLDGWLLLLGETVIHLGRLEGATVEVRRSIIEPNGFLLLERTDDRCVSDIEADVIYRGGLSNQGAILSVLDPSGAAVDTANLEGTAWPAGSAADGVPAYATMERISSVEGDRPENWGTNDGILCCGKDANGEPIQGTPRMKNAATTAWESYPLVVWLAPQAETMLAGVVEIAWSATDPDGSAEGLRIDLHLSRDNGETWEPIIEGLVNGGTYQWDTGVHPDLQNGLLKITATDQDGHIGEAVSPEFAIGNAG